jgi:hypothetical protein
VPEDTLASSDKEVELDMAAGNMSVRKKTPTKKNQEMIPPFVLFDIFLASYFYLK